MQLAVLARAECYHEQRATMVASYAPHSNSTRQAEEAVTDEMS